MRHVLGRGEDPFSLRIAAQAAVAAKLTFAQCAEQYIAMHSPGWKNPKHVDQWTNTLETYAMPIIGTLDVALVDTRHIVQILEPIWLSKNETASRIRGRVERVLAWAKTRGLRTGDNPATWRNHLDTLLPRPTSVQRQQHHAALPYKDIHSFVIELRAQPGVTAQALEFTILTATRTGEVIAATWEEINLREAVWIIPKTRMKAKREHRVPLSNRAVELLRQMKKTRKSDFVFPGWKAETGLSNMAMLQFLRKVGYSDLTVHGFRSTFRDWCAEMTTYPRELAEAALAHTLSNKAEAAYFRSDMFEKRREMMQAWCNYINTAPAEARPPAPPGTDRVEPSREAASI
ncbi:site-specific integrase [Burkholderia sp. Ax-1724]|uniref:tyrosine-type recombinase/integrase n=2 Tax=Burkholderiaceae TaxID=119060 RepID=UPI00141E608A|nr:site-specific integrase [Burkholderia sp. Ax-1724]